MITLIWCLLSQCWLRWSLISWSMLWMESLRASGFKNDIIAPRTRLWSSPLSSNKLFWPRRRRIEVGCWLESTFSLEVYMSLLAAGPWTRTLRLPNTFSFEIGPYLLILCRSQSSPLLALMAWRSWRLWPIIGIPKEPGGSRCFFFCFLIKMRTTKKRRDARIALTEDESIEVSWSWLCDCISWDVYIIIVRIHNCAWIFAYTDKRHSCQEFGLPCWHLHIIPRGWQQVFSLMQDFIYSIKYKK